MKIRLSKMLLIGLAIGLATTMALMSVFVQRTGPGLVQYGNVCGPTFDDPCYRPELKGGFPFAYLFDAPGVSRENQLAFFEDNLAPGVLVLDIIVYFAAILLASKLASRWWAAFTSRSKHSDA